GGGGRPPGPGGAGLRPAPIRRKAGGPAGGEPRDGAEVGRRSSPRRASLASDAERRLSLDCRGVRPDRGALSAGDPAGRGLLLREPVRGRGAVGRRTVVVRAPPALPFRGRGSAAVGPRPAGGGIRGTPPVGGGSRGGRHR